MSATQRPPHDPTRAMLRFFRYDHLRPDLAEQSKPLCDLAVRLVEEVPPGPEKTMGMRKLLEAKDCFVRARIPE